MRVRRGEYARLEAAGTVNRPGQRLLAALVCRRWSR